MKKSITLPFLFMAFIAFAQPKIHSITSSDAILPKQLFKISGGYYRMNDRHKLVNYIVGNSFSLSYERLSSRHFSMIFGIEYSRNNNPIFELKKRYTDINLPEKEERFSFFYETRFYKSKAGSGFYFSNSTAFQKQVNSELSFLHDCINCPDHSYFIYDTYAPSERFNIGYQRFINKKLNLGIIIGYELRLIFFKQLSHGPQMSIQIGFGK